MNEKCQDCGRPLHLDDIPPLCPECRAALALEIEEFALILEDEGE